MYIHLEILNAQSPSVVADIENPINHVENLGHQSFQGENEGKNCVNFHSEIVFLFFQIIIESS